MDWGLVSFPLSTIIALAGFASLLYETRTYFPRGRRRKVGDAFLAMQQAQRCLVCMQTQAKAAEASMHREDEGRRAIAEARAALAGQEQKLRKAMGRGVSHVPLGWRWPMRLMLRLPKPAWIVGVQLGSMVALLACVAAAGLIGLTRSFATAVAIQLGVAVLLCLGVAALDFSLRFTELMRRRSAMAFRVLVVMDILFVALFLTLSVPLLGRAQAELDIARPNLESVEVACTDGPTVTGFLIPVRGSSDAYVLTGKSGDRTTSQRIPGAQVESITATSHVGVAGVEP